VATVTESLMHLNISIILSVITETLKNNFRSLTRIIMLE